MPGAQMKPRMKLKPPDEATATTGKAYTRRTRPGHANPGGVTRAAPCPLSLTVDTNTAQKPKLLSARGNRQDEGQSGATTGRRFHASADPTPRRAPASTPVPARLALAHLAQAPSPKGGPQAAPRSHPKARLYCPSFSGVWPSGPAPWERPSRNRAIRPITFPSVPAAARAARLNFLLYPIVPLGRQTQPSKPSRHVDTYHSHQRLFLTSRPPHSPLRYRRESSESASLSVIVV
ncbi:hypothetical protein G7046_g271 [Stylonectria norvegica]|nr:hypothetical protein G7046_g271 [Stylonectria norvegica]